MPNLAQELSHLEDADRHIAQARDRITKATEQAQAIQRPDAEAKTASELLATMKETLAAFEAHRDLIVQTIADIRAGIVPST